MSLEIFTFYFFSFILLFSASITILAKNPIRSVLFLILSFVSASCLFISIGAPYIGFLMLIVYVGAVAILFLFVVMMLDVDFSQFRLNQIKSSFTGFLIFALLMAQFILTYFNFKNSKVSAEHFRELKIENMPENISNISQIGSVLYTKYFLFFQLSGLILLVAMIGAILLAFRRRENVKTQNPAKQSQRESSLKLEKPQNYKGIS